ncbi:MAG: arsenite methyltransferase [Saprospiraceae bacterium]|jgi:ubiquinone/menaquinone biosynthesis C-methylase UbiE|nr:arsenite methyltransferase [Saprospiraceae bacterium]MBL0025572.1 arsenite methyltransferase [Saprospiraceae bacterium]
MKSNQEIKDTVMQKYSEIALQEKSVNLSSCCGAGGCSSEVYNIMSDAYDKLEGYNPEADLGLGCGLPTEFALIEKGNVVLDLGSGAGNDAFVARSLTGPEGKVIGVDFTDAMINKARQNLEKLGYHNVEFRAGDIEDLPVNASSIDVIVSNCVLNLVPDKKKAFSEMFRVMKEGGHFSISDIVLKGTLPEGLQSAAEMYAGCVAGAILKSEYLKMLEETGFKNIKIQKEKAIIVPVDILEQYLNVEDLKAYLDNKEIIFSITVYGEKASQACCSDSCCS